MIRSIQKQKQTNSTKGAGVTQPPSQSVKQIQSQINQLQKQVARIQNDIQKIRTTSGSSTTTRAKSKNLASSRANIKPRSKKSKSLKSTKVRIKETLQSIVVSRAFTVHQLTNLIINELPSIIRELDTCLVIVPDLLHMFTQDPAGIDRKEGKHLITNRIFYTNSF